jgi:hypothetical protein
LASTTAAMLPFVCGTNDVPTPTMSVQSVSKTWHLAMSRCRCRVGTHSTVPASGSFVQRESVRMSCAHCAVHPCRLAQKN